jgi:hypothetical protein
MEDIQKLLGGFHQEIDAHHPESDRDQEECKQEDFAKADFVVHVTLQGKSKGR